MAFNTDNAILHNNFLFIDSPSFVLDMLSIHLINSSWFGASIISGSSCQSIFIVAVSLFTHATSTFTQYFIVQSSVSNDKSFNSDCLHWKNLV